MSLTPEGDVPLAERLRASETIPETKDILDLLARDPDRGWERLLRRVESKLRVLVHFRMSSRLRDVHDEDDILQEVWAEAARSLHRFEYRGPGSLQRWLAGILSNKLLHAGRDSERLPVPATAMASATTSAVLVAERLDVARALARTQSGVSRHARRRELESRVRDVLRRLPDGERETVLLRLFEGLSGREIAARLGVDESTISVRFKRALETCAVHLREFAP